MNMNVADAICKELWTDAQHNWCEALDAIMLKRDRPTAAKHLVMAHNCLCGIVIRPIPFPDREPEVCGITLTGFKNRKACIRQLLLGCIGEEGLSDIGDLTEVFATANTRYFRQAPASPKPPVTAPVVLTFFVNGREISSTDPYLSLSYDKVVHLAFGPEVDPGHYKVTYRGSYKDPAEDDNPLPYMCNLRVYDGMVFNAKHV